MIRVMLDKGAYMPEKAHKEDAGFDLRTPIYQCVPPNGSVVIDTGVHVEVPAGYVGMIKSKSGLYVKSNITTEGVIDAGYTGSIMVKMYNHGNRAHFFDKGDKITQLVLIPISLEDTMQKVDRLEDTDRGDGGFGSTGR